MKTKAIRDADLRVAVQKAANFISIVMEAQSLNEPSANMVGKMESARDEAEAAIRFLDNALKGANSDIREMKRRPLTPPPSPTSHTGQRTG